MVRAGEVRGLRIKRIPRWVGDYAIGGSIAAALIVAVWTISVIVGSLGHLLHQCK